MKILAIRGKNLASLAGEFVLDFESEPLASAGLYAITGATGSGKSTLLDALCLALYEQTPRLSGITGSSAMIDVGSNAIAASDVRTILRRGCSDGYAEVDFVGSDHVAYRARWSVRRAHGKANGKLQQSEISLARISDGQALGDHRKTETLKLIESFVGLSFAQFTRAVLLAQNDFAAFLKASDDARAELLQTLTGTESYAKISKFAFARMKAEQEKLAMLEAQQQAHAPLTVPLRAEKTAQLQAQSEQAEALAQQKLAIEVQLRWYQLDEQLKVAETLAQENLAAALAAKNAAAARAEQLARLDQIQNARPLCSELARLEQAEADAAQAHDFAQQAFAQAQARLDEFAAQQIAAQRQYNAAEAARLQAQAELDAARAWDARIDTITPQVATARQEFATAAAQVQLELSQRAQAIAQRQTDQAKLAASQQWLNNNDALQPLAESWQRWETLFDEAHKILDRQSSTDKRVEELTLEIAANEHGLISASEAQNLATQALRLTQARLNQLSADCSALDIEQLSVEKAALELRQEQLRAALNLWQKLVDVHSQIQKQSQLLRQHGEEHTANDETLRAGLQNLPLLACAEQIAKESLRLATLAAGENAETLRVALQPEQPCPVCGALAHPYALHAPAANVLKSLQDQLSAKEKTLREAEIAISTARENKARAEQALGEAQSLLNELAHEQAGLNADWVKQAMHSEIAAVPELLRVQNMTERQNAVGRELAQLRAREAHYRDVLKRKDLAQLQLNSDHASLTSAKAALGNLESVHSAAKQNLTNAQRDLAELTEQLAARQSQLDSAIQAPAWRNEWRQDPNAFVARRRSDAETWAAQITNVATLNTHIAQLQIKIDAFEKSCQLAQDQHEGRREKHADLALELQSYRQHRDALFTGQPTAQVAATLDAAVLQAKRVLATAQAQLQHEHAELARTQEALSQTGLRLEQERSAVKVAQFGLHAWLLKFNSENAAEAQNLTLVALDSMLKITPEWCANERAALEDLARAVHGAQAVVDARSRSRSAHLAEQSVLETVEVLAAKHAQLALEGVTLSETLSSLKLEIALDTERVRQSAALSGKIEKQTAETRIWAQLGELIGSADGKKFRNFAQQLTLDILLNYANIHLQTLTRRYRVQRINDSLGLLVVDQDMGDELRSVHSLSGGESFLLSLALALGLASLSSHRVQVESLFIDEGFGSLDAESLGVAMDALDNLQSQGRKIGVISHLQELTERIGVKVQVQRQVGGVSRICF